MGKGRIKLDIIGQKFNRLLVVEQVEDEIDAKSEKHKSRYKCLCDCGNYTIQRGTDVKSGRVKSCGCLHREVSAKTISESTHGKKYNEYDLSGNYGVGYTFNGEEFYFDLEDYDKIKNICWYKNSRGYLAGHDISTGKTVKMQNVILPHNKDGVVVDHINTHMKNDNRKNNLRIITQQKNTMNRKRPSNNTSVVTGVTFDKRQNKWTAYIGYNKKHIHLGYFTNKSDAIKARKDAEEKYFGEYSYDNSMKLSSDNIVREENHEQ